MGGGAGRPGAAAGLGAGRRAARRARPRGPAVRPGDDGRQRLAHRRRRADARRRDGLAGPAARAGLRQRRRRSRWSPPTGEVVRASADEHPDLFWGAARRRRQLRRGHRVRVPAAPGRHAGARGRVRVPGSSGAAGRCAAGATCAGGARAQATFTAAIGERRQVTLGFVWVGDPGRGPAAAARRCARSAGRSAERVRELSYLELQTPRRQHRGPRAAALLEGSLPAASCPTTAIEAFLRRDPAIGGPAGAGLQAYGGAIADVPDDDTAFSHRDALVEFGAGDELDRPGRGRRADRGRPALRRRAGAVRQRGLRQRAQRRGRRGRAPRLLAAKLARLTAVKDARTTRTTCSTSTTTSGPRRARGAPVPPKGRSRWES